LRVAQADGQSGVAAGESPTGVALWGQAFGGNATQDQRDGISGYHAGYNGLLIGADTMLNDNWRVGGLGSYANTSVANDGDNSGSSTHVTSYGLIGYAAYTTDKWYLDMSAGAVQQQYNSVRAIGFNGFSGTANGQFNGMQYVASVQGGYPIKLASDTTLTPLAGLSYSRQHQDAYTETGGNGAALSVGATNSNSVKSDIGAKLERSFATAYGALAPSAQLTWRHEYNKNGVQSVASYAADTTGTTSFTTLGPTPVADTGVLALAVTLTRSENVRLTARYTVEAASGYTSQTADVRLRYQF
jgi:outer membrane autotransporter protein